MEENQTLRRDVHNEDRPCSTNWSPVEPPEEAIETVPERKIPIRGSSTTPAQNQQHLSKFADAEDGGPTSIPKLGEAKAANGIVLSPNRSKTLSPHAINSPYTKDRSDRLDN